MTLDQDGMTLSIEDVRRLFLRHFPQLAQTLEGTMLSGLTAPDVAFEGGGISLSAKKRIPFLGDIQAAIKLRPVAAATAPHASRDDLSIRLKIEKIVAGPIETKAFAKLIMSRISARIAHFPGCRVDGDDLLFDLTALAAENGITLSGRIVAVRMRADAIAVSLAEGDDRQLA